ncbi:MAG TPA: glycosyltransferase family 9 protein [Chthoniobacterales bacterium]|jgi:ADP-heptose:LPS heptosyltransferase/lauroyl/myristoyl acyltransferase
MDRVVYAIVLVVVTAIRALPLKVCFALGWSIGAVLWAILPGYRRLARENLQRAFDGEKSPAAVRRLTFRHFTALGANACCAFKMAAMTEAQIHDCLTIENGERVLEALRKNRGVVLIISHIGNWELFAQLSHLGPGYQLATIYQAIRNRGVDELINGDRRRKGVIPLDRKRGVARAMSILREGGLVGVLIDQHAGDAGIWMPFFNSLASTSPLAATLATRTNAVVLPCAIYTDGFARWRFVVDAEVDYNDSDADALTATLNRTLETQIRRSPADWFWVHNRWKVPHPDFLLAQTKRGLYLPAGTDPMTLRPFRILIRSSNWLGDAVMSSLAVRAIKEGRPDARVTVLTRDKLADYWRSMPEVDEVIGVPEDAGVFKVGWRLRGRFDVAVLFPNSARSALEVWIGGIRRRVGYLGHNREWMLNQIIPEPKKEIRPRHHAARYLRMAEKMGAPSIPLSFPTAPCPTGPIRIGVCPGAEYGGAKRWYPQRFRRMMQQVSAQIDCTWVVVGVGRDVPLANELLEGLDGKVENLTGRTSLGQLIEELRDMHTLVTNDTGTMHLAASLGTPVVALFGSTEPLLTRPLGPDHTIIRHQVECSPCFQRECPLDFRCMEAITVDEVAEAVIAKVNQRMNSAVPTN